MKLNFEDIVKNKIDGFEFEYEAGEWDKLQKRLSPKNFWTKGRLWTISAITLLLSGLGLFLLLEPGNTPSIPTPVIADSNAIPNTPPLSFETIPDSLRKDTLATSSDQKTTTKENTTTKQSNNKTNTPAPPKNTETTTDNTPLKQKQATEKSKDPEFNVGDFYIKDVPANGCTPFTIQPSSTYYSPEVNYYWNFGDNTDAQEFNPNHTYTSPGEYTVQLIVDNGYQTFIYQEIITIYPRPTADFEWGNQGYRYRFTAKETNLETYLWKIDNQSTAQEHSFEKELAPENSYFVSLHLTNEFGCTDSIQKEITVNRIHQYWVPNSFTPDGDGVNDKFGPVGQELYELDYHLSIYDKSGKLVFESRNPDQKWQGNTLLPSSNNEVFIWKIKTKDRTGHIQSKQGTVTRIK